VLLCPGMILINRRLAPAPGLTVRGAVPARVTHVEIASRANVLYGKVFDPRKSIAERYPDREAYLKQFARAAGELIDQRWILPEDRAPLLERGAQEWDLLAH
jgi:hypothetical protein